MILLYNICNARPTEEQAINHTKQTMIKNVEIFSQNARRFGTFLGLFWIAKFILFPIGLSMALIQLLFIVLTLAVPFIGYRLVKTYRDKACMGYISFNEAFIFSLLMYFYASLLVAVAHYIYFQFIDNGFVIESYEGMIDSIASLGDAALKSSIDQLKQNIEVFRSLSSLQITFELIMNNLMWGFLFSLPTAGFVMKKEKK